MPENTLRVCRACGHRTGAVMMLTCPRCGGILDPLDITSDQLRIADLERELDSIMKLTESLHDSPLSLHTHLTHWAKQRRLAKRQQA